MDSNNNISKEKDEWTEMAEKFKETGDLQLLGKLYTEFTPLVYGVCLKYLKNKNNSKDAVAEIFESLIKKLRSHSVKAFKPWLYMVSRNHCFEILRKNQRELEKKNEANSVYSAEVFHPNEYEEKEKEMRQLEDCIAELSEKQQTCINLFYFEKMTYQEISEKLKVGWSVIRTSIQNGRRNLKNCLEKKSIKGIAK